MGSDQSFAGVIALDGPSGTGKSTVAVLRRGVDLADPVAITRVVEAAKIVISTDPQQVSITLDGEPVDVEIRSADTTAAVSAVSAVAAVRALLVDAQRELISDGGIVVEGRDIGSVVWPTARPKVYLTASPEARARRRAGELQSDIASVAADIKRRDELDSSRAASPLMQAPDATELDTTDLDIDQVVARLVQLTTESAA